MLHQNDYKAYIETGKFVIVRKLKGESVKVFKAGKNETTTIENLSFRNSSAVGLRYGKVYEVVNGQILELVPIPDIDPISISLQSESIDNLLVSDSRKRVVQGGDEEDEPPTKVAGQSMTAESIAKLKSSGASVNEVVSKLVIGNTNFNDRTVYSQAKYVSKKDKIHDSRVVFLQPTSRLLNLAYYEKNAEKINYLRYDVFANIISYMNIVPGCKVLIYEETQGLLTGAILQRLEGKGEVFIVNQHGISASNFPAFYNYNLSPAVYSTARPIRFQTFYRVLAGEYKSSTPCTEEPMEYESEELKEPSTPLQYSWIRERLFAGAGLDAVVFAGELVCAGDFIKHIFRRVRKSGSIVAHSNIESDAVETAQVLQSLSCLDVQIQSYMNRHIQAIPDCSHPMLSDVVTSGYLVNCFKVGD